MFSCPKRIYRGQKQIYKESNSIKQALIALLYLVAVLLLSTLTRRFFTEVVTCSMEDSFSSFPISLSLKIKAIHEDGL
jgi:hypothetical protein